VCDAHGFTRSPPLISAPVPVIGHEAGAGVERLAPAFAVASVGVISRGAFGLGTSVILDGGVGWGTSENLVAGRAGLTFGW